MNPHHRDAYRGVNSNGRDSEKLASINKAKSGQVKKCPRDVLPTNLQQMRSILYGIEKEHPKKASHSLQKVAELSLFQGHQGHVDEQVAEWRPELRGVAFFWEDRAAMESQSLSLKQELKVEKMLKSQLSKTVDELKIVQEQKTITSKYKGLWQELRAENEDLETRLEEADLKLGDMWNMEELIRQQSTQLSDLRDKFEANKRHAGADLAYQMRITAKLQGSLIEEYRQSNENSRKLKVMNGKYTWLVAIRETLQRKLAELKEESVKLREGRDKAISQRDGSEERVSSLRLQLADKDQEIEEAILQLYQAERTKKAISKDFEGLQHDLTRMAQRADDLRQQTDTFEEKLASAFDALEKNQLSGDVLRNEAIGLEKELSTAQSMLNQTQSEANYSRNQAHALNKELASAQSTLNETRLDADNLRTQVKILTEQHARANGTLDEIRLELQSARKENEDAAIVAAAREKNWSEENSHLVKRVEELELRFSERFLWKVLKNFKGVMVHLARWVCLKPKNKAVSAADVEQ
jgi:predicted  nucleic acid-binding Zn-ribbon protein